jgi:hypothetical protein
MTITEKITKALAEKPTTAKALEKRFRISKMNTFRILHKIARKKGKVREGSSGPLSVVWELRPGELRK